MSTISSSLARASTHIHGVVLARGDKAVSWAWHLNQTEISKRTGPPSGCIPCGEGSTVHVAPIALTLLPVRCRLRRRDKLQTARDEGDPEIPAALGEWWM